METEEQPKEYTNRELYMLFSRLNETNQLQHKAISESLANFHITTNATLESILNQTKRTNGNVMDLLLWKMYVKGQTWVIPIVVGSVVSCIVAIIFNEFK